MEIIDHRDVILAGGTFASLCSGGLRLQPRETVLVKKDVLKKDPYFFLQQHFPHFTGTWWKLTEVSYTELSLGWGHFTSDSGNIMSIFRGLYSLFFYGIVTHPSLNGFLETRTHFVHHRLMNKWDGEQLLSAKFVFLTTSLSFWERWL